MSVCRGLADVYRSRGPSTPDVPSLRKCSPTSRDGGRGGVAGWTGGSGLRLGAPGKEVDVTDVFPTDGDKWFEGVPCHHQSRLPVVSTPPYLSRSPVHRPVGHSLLSHIFPE